jgi:hypothetical protein
MGGELNRSTQHSHSTLELEIHCLWDSTLVTKVV